MARQGFRWLRRAGAVTAAAVVAATALTGTGAAAADEENLQQFGLESVKWAPCPDAVFVNDPQADRTRFGCATYKVPIDYRKPSTGSVEIALLRRLADDPARRIGSMFINPGGPGGSGYLGPIRADRRYGAEVLKRFDIVGFDPRGVARSSPLRCFSTAEEAEKVFSRQPSVPFTAQEVRDAVQAGKDYSAACAKNAGPLIRHMSTKNVVRDLDVLRQAVGDEKLTFVGFSYGTLIGSTYANMFPKRTRAIVIDGNVDPELRTGDGLESDRQRAEGFELALDGFLKRCTAAGPKCAFSEGDTRKKFDALRTRLQREPIALPTGVKLTLSAFTSNVSSAMYGAANFAPLAVALQQAYTAMNPADAGIMAESATEAPSDFLTKNDPTGRRDALADTPYTGDDSFYGVNCIDKPYLRLSAAYPVIAKIWERQFPTFGRFQAFDAVPCASWPGGSDRYAGPWHKKTANPIVVIGNYYDPATPYAFSQRMAKQLGSARLVSVDSFGHAILGRSKCADDITTAYLSELKAPADGIICQPNAQPFA
ncbi:alpha/beta hydrolase [Crossiella cryophila]|uniref:Pimeloyl-ACP methyl ester carboxylesterase n=1 Tax=Crossiella cryophila TaxID=43355 RepID=A0A7W7CAM6_9PSEU|nr:alpha/beta hydrolase [Crossiella cryophila]MBB4677621.1 pimeloyl-ACP methyl ester carboxylesterase [Crossiella cryophila]